MLCFVLLTPKPSHNDFEDSVVFSKALSKLNAGAFFCPARSLVRKPL